MDDIAETLGTSLDAGVILLSAYTCYTAGADCIQYFKNDEFAESAEAFLVASGTALLTVGYLMKKKLSHKLIAGLIKAGAKLAAREAAVTSLAACSTVAAPVVMAIGTAINTILFLKDLPELFSAAVMMFDDEPNRTAYGLWAMVEAPFDRASNQQFMNRLNDIKKRLEEHPTLKGRMIDMELVFEFVRITPYKNYTTWDKSTDNKTRAAANYIEDHHCRHWAITSLDLDGIGVNWGMMNWRAVIPLWLMGYTVAEIKELVVLGDLDGFPFETTHYNKQNPDGFLHCYVEFFDMINDSPTKKSPVYSCFNENQDVILKLSTGEDIPVVTPQQNYAWKVWAGAS